MATSRSFLLLGIFQNLALFLVSLPAVGADPSASALAACSEIISVGANIQTWPWALFDFDYLYAKDHYWSAANADSTPACVVFPTTAEEVSGIVSTLLKYPDVSFAVKSGGHNPNVGFSSVDGGVLISMTSLATTTISNDSLTADIGPGSRWGAVIDTLTPHNLTVVGGRIGDVGVGGYLLGGGLSFLSTEYGLACDSIVNYEVVLADASIVNANSTSNTDLFWALKGGGNQFGIVTKYTMETKPMQQVWGGIRTYSSDNAAAILAATQDLTENYHDVKAAVIVTGEIALATLIDNFIIFFFYNGPSPPPGVFDKFDAIPSQIDSTTTQSYAELLSANGITNLYGLRYLIRGTTLPNLPSTTGAKLYLEHYEMWKSYVTMELSSHIDCIFSLAFQPLPYLIPAASQAAGGNALAMDPAAGDRLWMEYDVSWLTGLTDNDAHVMAMNITKEIDEHVATNYAGVPNSHYVSGDMAAAAQTPIFLNDAMYDQLPLQSYGNGSYERLKAIQQTLDPTGFFSGRTGGFKFT